jgi:hypothetical protein
MKQFIALIRKTFQQMVEEAEKNKAAMEVPKWLLTPNSVKARVGRDMTILRRKLKTGEFVFNVSKDEQGHEFGMPMSLQVIKARQTNPNGAAIFDDGEFDDGDCDDEDDDSCHESPASPNCSAFDEDPLVYEVCDENQKESAQSLFFVPDVWSPKKNRHPRQVSFKQNRMENPNWQASPQQLSLKNWQAPLGQAYSSTSSKTKNVHGSLPTIQQSRPSRREEFQPESVDLDLDIEEVERIEFEAFQRKKRRFEEQTRGETAAGQVQKIHSGGFRNQRISSESLRTPPMHPSKTYSEKRSIQMTNQTFQREPLNRVEISPGGRAQRMNLSGDLSTTTSPLNRRFGKK